MTEPAHGGASANDREVIGVRLPRAVGRHPPINKNFTTKAPRPAGGIYAKSFPRFVWNSVMSTFKAPSKRNDAVKEDIIWANNLFKLV